MSGVVPAFVRGPITYEVTEAVLGGQIVEARAASKIGVGAAGSTVVLGVALGDAKPQTDHSADVNTDGFPVLDISLIDQYVAVGGRGEFYREVKYTAITAFGKAVKAGATGQVSPWVSGTDAADLIIGYCAEPAGATAGGTALTCITR